LGIGHNAIRRCLFERLLGQEEVFVTALHPSAVVARDIQIGMGTVIAAGVILNPGTQIGDNAILNTGCTVDHHNQIGDHTHIAPGVHLGGDVVIGAESLIGIGATVMPQCIVGEKCIVGAGSLVHRDLPAGVTAMGVPAKISTIGRNLKSIGCHMNSRIYLSSPHMSGLEEQYVQEAFATNWIAPVGPACGCI
jgi:sugar O-acyltransferase (sialic acid O-acetyltransferase NeuD family)